MPLYLVCKFPHIRRDIFQMEELQRILVPVKDTITTTTTTTTTHHITVTRAELPLYSLGMMWRRLFRESSDRKLYHRQTSLVYVPNANDISQHSGENALDFQRKPLIQRTPTVQNR
ncbi:hypothetical protein CEXT_164051 [Caerostris extrusa]|uniref:Uncharacterized protein n=1 Tax=Caerostris extrusa TaxID=172846 RepID=A0AAV4NMZ9_CAEEX|nr:hypothetical protein CEXT_164051 [Caerostris extrusa]